MDALALTLLALSALLIVRNHLVYRAVSRRTEEIHEHNFQRRFAFLQRSGALRQHALRHNEVDVSPVLPRAVSLKLSSVRRLHKP
jgi:hypothetical protein